jgi:CRP-like cAMP-binding protein
LASPALNQQNSPGTDNPLLRKLGHFAAFDEACRPALEALFYKSKTVPRHRDLIKDGDDASEVFLLLRGWAARYKITANGERQIVSFLVPGDVFPIHTMPVGKMDHGIVALTTCHLAATAAERFDTAVLHHPELAQAFWWITIQDKGVLRAWLVNIGHRDAYARIAHLICEIAARLRMVGLGDGLTFDFPLTQQEIAEAQGLTPVHTNRMLQQLRRDGLIELDQKTLMILDLKRLWEVAEFDPAYLNPGAGRSVRPQSIS